MVLELVRKYYDSNPKISLVNERRALKQGMDEFRIVFDKREEKENQINAKFNRDLELHNIRRRMEINLLKS